MATPTVVKATWSDGKCETFHLTKNGSFFGYMHPSGSALKFNLLPIVAEYCTFIPCKNRGRTNDGSLKYTLCALSCKKYSEILPGTEFACTFALMLGVVHDACHDLIEFHYLEWNGCIMEHDSISDVMMHCSSPQNFIKKFFCMTPRKTAFNKMHVRFLNQVSGPSPLKRPISSNLAPCQGDMFHQMNIGPYQWAHW
jgi:hypothetical protein